MNRIRAMTLGGILGSRGDKWYNGHRKDEKIVT